MQITVYIINSVTLIDLLEICDSKPLQYSNIDGDNCPNMYNSGMLSDEESKDSSGSMHENSALTCTPKRDLPASTEVCFCLNDE